MDDDVGTDREHMRRCLALAAQAKAEGETAVGSVVVGPDQSRVGEGAEATRGRLDPSAHAEMEAIRAACSIRGSTDLSDCTLYTTVEPCLLCAFAIRSTGIRRVIVGTRAGEVGAVDGKYPFLTDSTFSTWKVAPKVTRGVLRDEARRLLTSD